MPNPKVGTVTMDVAQAVKNAKGGEVQFKVEKAGVIHGGVGKASFDPTALVENVKAFVQAVNRAKPRGRQGHLPEEDLALLDHGAGRDRRHRQRGRRANKQNSRRRRRDVPGGQTARTVRDGGLGAEEKSEAPEILPETGNDQDRIGGLLRAVLAGP